MYLGFCQNLDVFCGIFSFIFLYAIFLKKEPVNNRTPVIYEYPLIWCLFKGVTGGNKMRESQLILNIRKYLDTIPGCFYWKEHGGQYGTAGIPDIIVCHKGKFIALEAKVGRNQPTRLQAATIELIRRAGGVAAVVRSVDEVKEIMQTI